MDKGPSKQANRRHDNHCRVIVSQALALQEMLGDMVAATFLQKRNVSPTVIDSVLKKPADDSAIGPSTR